MTDDEISQNAVVIERSFDAPADLIWQMWTEPEHFKAWCGPDGAAVPVAKMDVRVGGSRLVCMDMETPNGLMQMWFTGEYREVVQNVRLVYTESMSDENGNVLSPLDMGMPPGHPTTTEVTVELEDVSGRTSMSNTFRVSRMARAHSMARPGLTKVTRNPSPAVSTSRPPKHASCCRTTRSWRSSRSLQSQSPSWAARLVEPTMSINNTRSAPEPLRTQTVAPTRYRQLS